jgi:carotenoid cleavage dioxygenase
MTDVPIHLAGNNGPVADEVTHGPLEVRGRLPLTLNGCYYRNGPNPRTGRSAHLFAGDGMVHGIAIEDGRAHWYRNRWVRTPLYEHPGEDRYALALDAGTGRIDHRVTTANTHVVVHAGRLLALEEGGLPYELTPELDTIGPFTFGGALRGAMTAHPKACPTTGELLFFGYSIVPPHLTYHRASADGRLLSSRVIDVPRATMMHDFAITASRAVFHDSPVVFDHRALTNGGLPWRWDDDHGSRFGVLDRSGNGDIRWFEIDPCHLSHAMNAHDDGDAIVVTGCRIESMWRAGSDDLSGALPLLHEWRLDLATGRTTERQLDDATTDYPRVADAEVGRRSRFGYSTDFVLDAEPDHGEIYRYDLEDGGTRTTHRFPTGHTCGEPVFVDDVLLTFVHDRGAGTSYLAVLDADDLAGDPLAEVHVPVRVPGGFHGTWVDSAH